MGFFSTAQRSPDTGQVLSGWANDIKLEKHKKAVSAFGNDMMAFIDGLPPEKKTDMNILRQGEAEIAKKYSDVLTVQDRKMSMGLIKDYLSQSQQQEEYKYNKGRRNIDDTQKDALFDLNKKVANKKLNAVPKKSYHYTQDDQGNTSVYADGQLMSGSGQGKPAGKFKDREQQALNTLGAYVKNIGGDISEDGRYAQINLSKTGVDRNEILKKINQTGFEFFGKQIKQDRDYWFTGDDDVLVIDIGAFTGKKSGDGGDVVGGVGGGQGGMGRGGQGGQGGSQNRPGLGDIFGGGSNNKALFGKTQDNNTQDQPAQPQPTQINEQLPPDPATWDVKLIPQNGRQVPVVMVNGKPVPLTEEEYAAYRKVSGTSSAANDIFSFFKKNMTGTKQLPTKGLFK